MEENPEFAAVDPALLEEGEEERVRVEEEKVRLEEEKVRMEKMSKEQQKLVECPVCRALPREYRAVPCCPQGHFVCPRCMAKIISYTTSLPIFDLHFTSDILYFATFYNAHKNFKLCITS